MYKTIKCNLSLSLSLSPLCVCFVSGKYCILLFVFTFVIVSFIKLFAPQLPLQPLRTTLLCDNIKTICKQRGYRTKKIKSKQYTLYIIDIIMTFGNARIELNLLLLSYLLYTCHLVNIGKDITRWHETDILAYVGSFEQTEWPKPNLVSIVSTACLLGPF